MQRNSKTQKGFTLIELIVVLIILGILAAFAIPRFINIATDARRASINGLAGTLRSTAALVHGLALARNVVNDPGTGTPPPIQLEGVGIAIVNGYPAATAAGIEAAMTNMDGYTKNYAAGVATYEVTGAPDGANCRVTYTQAGVGGGAVVSTPLVTGC